MTLPEVEMLSAYWERCPPVHLLVRNAVGFKPSAKAKSAAPATTSGFKVSSAEEVLGFFSEFESKTGSKMGVTT